MRSVAKSLVQSGKNIGRAAWEFAHAPVTIHVPRQVPPGEPPRVSEHLRDFATKVGREIKDWDVAICRAAVPDLQFGTIRFDESKHPALNGLSGDVLDKLRSTEAGRQLADQIGSRQLAIILNDEYGFELSDPVRLRQGKEVHIDCTAHLKEHDRLLYRADYDDRVELEPLLRAKLVRDLALDILRGGLVARGARESQEGLIHMECECHLLRKGRPLSRETAEAEVRRRLFTFDQLPRRPRSETL